MAIIKYNYSDGEYLKVCFTCSICGKQTEFISPKLPMIDKPCCSEITAQCGCKFILDIMDRGYEATMEIIGLPNESIISSHPIRWEDYNGYDSTFIDSIEELYLIEKCIDTVSLMDKPCKEYLYGALWCRIISLFDFYCHYSIERRVLEDSNLWNRFAIALDKHSDNCTIDKIKKWLRGCSFQSMKVLPKVFHQVFDYDIANDDVEKLKLYVIIRNNWTHHQGRGKNNERDVFAKDNLMALFAAVRTLIRDMQKMFSKYDANYLSQIIAVPLKS